MTSKLNFTCQKCKLGLEKDVVLLHCSHVFHNQCISLTCPCCKKKSEDLTKIIFYYNKNYGSIDSLIKSISNKDPTHDSQGRETMLSNIHDNKATYHNSTNNANITSQLVTAKAENELLKNANREANDQLWLYDYKLSNSEEKCLQWSKEFSQLHSKYQNEMEQKYSIEEQCNYWKKEYDQLSFQKQELESIVKEKDTIIQNNKILNQLLDNDNIESVCNIVRNLIDNNDNGRTLSEYVYLLHQRHDMLKKEVEELKITNSSIINNISKHLLTQVNKTNLYKMIDELILPYKNKGSSDNQGNTDKEFNTISCDNINNSHLDNKKAQDNRSESNDDSTPSRNCISNSLKVFSNPLNRNKQLSFMKKSS